MADENIEQLNIEINVSGADVADQRLKSMESRLKSIRDAVPSINSQMSGLARNISNVGGGKKFGKQWDYLNSPVEVLNAKIRRITNETERYKKAWQETDDTEAQDKLASKIESNTEKLRKLNDEKAKLSEGGEGEATGFDGMLKNVQALSGMFGKTGGQIAGLLGKAESLKSTFAGLAGTVGKIALPVALVVGSEKTKKGE